MVQVIQHPSIYWDLALIKVDGKIHGSPISLPKGPEESPHDGERVFVMGWGRVCEVRGKECSNQDHTSDILQEGIILRKAKNI